MGPSIKHVTLEGEGFEKVWQFVTGWGRFKSMWRHAYKFFYLTYETWNLKWCLTFCCNRCILTEGGTDKNHPVQDLPDKGPSDKTSWTETPTNNGERICTGGFCPGFCTRPTNNRGVRDVWRTFGGPRDVWQSVTGEGLKLAKHSA